MVQTQWRRRGNDRARDATCRLCCASACVEFQRCAPCACNQSHAATSCARQRHAIDSQHSPRSLLARGTTAQRASLCFRSIRTALPRRRRRYRSNRDRATRGVVALESHARDRTASDNKIVRTHAREQTLTISLLVSWQSASHRCLTALRFTIHSNARKPTPGGAPSKLLRKSSVSQGDFLSTGNTAPARIAPSISRTECMRDVNNIAVNSSHQRLTFQLFGF